MDDGRALGDGEQRPAVPGVVRAGCVALSILGVVSLFLAVPTVVNPGNIRCSLARTLVDDANHDGKKFNDVDLGGRQVEDLSCAEALPLADGIRRDEDSDKTASVPSESLIRNRGFMSGVVAASQTVTGFLTLTTLRRRTRTAALVFVGLGVLVPVLGLLSVLVLGFVIYAIGFSPASRAIWPNKPRASGST
jgi:hypothetical protein